MRIKTLMAGSLLVAAGLAFAGLAPAQSERGAPGQSAVRTPAAGPGGLITVLNPIVANKMAERIPLTPRLDTIEGKTIYMVDINWGGPEAAYSVFEEVQDWFARNKPSVKTVIKRKRGSYSSDDPELWKEMAANKAHAAIIGISG